MPTRLLALALLCEGCLSLCLYDIKRYTGGRLYKTGSSLDGYQCPDERKCVYVDPRRDGIEYLQVETPVEGDGMSLRDGEKTVRVARSAKNSDAYTEKHGKFSIQYIPSYSQYWSYQTVHYNRCLDDDGPCRGNVSTGIWQRFPVWSLKNTDGTTAESIEFYNPTSDPHS